MWANRSICSYSDFNLGRISIQNRVRKKNQTVGMETLNTHFLLTVSILYKRTKFPSNIVFTSQSHKVAYFYNVGSTYAIDQKINHLHNDRVANMWRNNVPSVCGRG
jgi:hypothetical protein